LIKTLLSAEIRSTIAGIDMRRLVVSLLVLAFLTAPYLTNSLSVEADYTPQSSGTLNLSTESGVSWAEDDVAYAMTPIDSENSTMLAGYTTSFGAGGSDVWLVKVTNTLNFLDGEPWFYRDRVDWSKTYGGAQDDGAKSVIQAGDGGHIIAGYTESYGAGGSDMYLIKVDSEGNLLWDRTYGGSQDDGANCIVQAGDMGCVIAGYTTSDAPSQSAWLVKTDTSGQMQFNRTVPGLEVNSIVSTEDGGYVLATRCFAGFGLVKLDSSCQVEWNQTYAASDNSAAESAIQTSDEGYAIAGWENSSETSTSARLIKTDSYGNVQWDQTYAGLGAYALIQTSSGGYALTGDRAFLMITDSSGNVQWNRNYDALSEDNLHYTRNYYVAEINSTQFVMAGTQQSYGQILRGLDGRMIRVTLRYAAESTPESTPAPTSTPSPTPTLTPTPTPTATPTPQPTATPTPFPTASPSQEPTPTPGLQEESRSSMTIPVVFASVLITNAVGGSLLYFKKRNHQAENDLVKKS
jgi:cell division septation protein DedD